MKKVLALIILLSSTVSFAQNDSTASAQTDTSRSKVPNFNDTITSNTKKKVPEFLSFEFAPGIAIPSGNFASGDYTNPLAGYAKEGYCIGANVSVKITDFLNGMISVTHIVNTFDAKSFETNELKGTSNFTLQPDANWRNTFLMAGLSGNIPLDEDNFLTPRLLVGASFANTPKYETFAIKTGSSTVSPTVVTSKPETKFAMRIGVGLKKNITKQLFMTINPDFYFTKLKTNINTTFPTSVANHQSISIICVSLSVGFRIYD